MSGICSAHRHFEPGCKQCQALVTARHDKATGGRTGAAAVDQAIADVREALGNALAIMRGLMTDPKVTRTTDLTPEIEECSSALAALRVLADAVEELRDERRVACEWAAELAGVKRAAEADLARSRDPQEPQT